MLQEEHRDEEEPYEWQPWALVAYEAVAGQVLQRLQVPKACHHDPQHRREAVEDHPCREQQEEHHHRVDPFRPSVGELHVLHHDHHVEEDHHE